MGEAWKKADCELENLERSTKSRSISKSDESVLLPSKAFTALSTRSLFGLPPCPRIHVSPVGSAAGPHDNRGVGATGKKISCALVMKRKMSVCMGVLLLYTWSYGLYGQTVMPFLSDSFMRSAIMAINSELVGLPRSALTV